MASSSHHRIVHNSARTPAAHGGEPRWTRALRSSRRGKAATLNGLTNFFAIMRIPHDRDRHPVPGCLPRPTATASKGSRRARLSAVASRSRGRVVERRCVGRADGIALGLVNVVRTLSPEPIILGGGAKRTRRNSFSPSSRHRLRNLAGEYFDTAALRQDRRRRRPGWRSAIAQGAVGARELARVRAAGAREHSTG